MRTPPEAISASQVAEKEQDVETVGTPEGTDAIAHVPVRPIKVIRLSYVLAALTDFCIASIILMGVMTYYKVPLSLHLLYAIPIIVLLGGVAAAVALFLSAVQVRFRDMGLAMPFLLQIWMFTV